ncbi:MAG TPA: citryl-CoA lyase [Acidothermaceae bacterium]
MNDPPREISEEWSTAIIETAPGVIRLRGYPIEQVIDRLSYAGTVWLMLTGELANGWQERLLNAALVAGVDHGPQAPSVAASRMAATCGVGLSQAVATGVNMLGDVHGGAGEACMRLLADIRDRQLAGADLGEVAAGVVAEYRERRAYLPGFGHRMHTHDPRRDPLLGLLRSAEADGAVAGDYLRAVEALERELQMNDRRLPLNIDGATAVIYSELGLLPPLGKGLFALSRSVGLLAHAYEQSQQGGRIKGPLPAGVGASYTGVARRDIAPERRATTGH